MKPSPVHVKHLLETMVDVGDVIGTLEWRHLIWTGNGIKTRSMRMLAGPCHMTCGCVASLTSQISFCETSFFLRNSQAQSWPEMTRILQFPQFQPQHRYTNQKVKQPSSAIRIFMEGGGNPSINLVIGNQWNVHCGIPNAINLFNPWNGLCNLFLVNSD